MNFNPVQKLKDSLLMIGEAESRIGLGSRCEADRKSSSEYWLRN